MLQGWLKRLLFLLLLERWTETLLWVKNIPADAEESDLHEAFPDAEDITMHHRVGKMNGPKETK